MLKKQNTFQSNLKNMHTYPITIQILEVSQFIYIILNSNYT